MKKIKNEKDSKMKDEKNKIQKTKKNSAILYFVFNTMNGLLKKPIKRKRK